MKMVKHVCAMGCVLLLTMLLVACGGSGTTTATTPVATATSTPTVEPTLAATATSTTAAAFIKTAQVTISGKQVTVLTNAQGLTLYYLTKDSATKVTCSGGCASAWPPLLFADGGTPPTSATLATKLTVFDGANGKQVEYDGHPLYTYQGDTAAGQANGNGVGGVWYAMQSTGYSVSG